MNTKQNQKSKSRDLAELVLGMAFVWFTFLVLAYHLYGDDTPRSQLPLMSFNEGQPHLTFNELAWFVDAMTFPALKAYPANASPDLNVPVAEGDLFIVPDGATGDWYGHDKTIAQYRNAAWEYIQPATGWRVDYPVTAFGEYYKYTQILYTGSIWVPIDKKWYEAVSFGANEAPSSGAPVTTYYDTTQWSIGPIIIQRATTHKPIFHLYENDDTYETEIQMYDKTGVADSVRISTFRDSHFPGYIKSASGYQIGNATGITKTVTFTDAGAVAHTIQISGGIIIDWATQ